jgi:hypothetical protein
MVKAKASVPRPPGEHIPGNLLELDAGAGDEVRSADPAFVEAGLHGPSRLEDSAVAPSL